MRGGKRPGAGRKPAPSRQAITVRVKPETAKRFSDHCKASNKSQSSTFADWVNLLANSDVSCHSDESTKTTATATLTEPDIDTVDTDSLISNAGDIDITIVTTHDGDTILIPWHMLDEVSIQDQRIQSLNHRHITRPHTMPPASISLDN